MHSYEAAMRIPRHDIELTFCNHCGFIFNPEFNPGWDYYTKGYEDQQGFSPTFVKFITAITERLIDKHGVRHKQVLEIGCGKGDFLCLVCDLGHNQGVGIDPAWVAGRTPDRPDVRFIREFYSARHAQIEADCVLCRHTLEHIDAVDAFLATIRAACEGRDTIVFFEVPNVQRILEVQAFWDIFTEHCSYFSPASLARLFRRNHFEVLDLYLGYDDQYLFIEARPAGAAVQAAHPLEEAVEVLRAQAHRFATAVEDQLQQWRARLLDFKQQRKKVVLWGGGSKAVGFLTQFDGLGAIDHVVDINPHLVGNFIPGIGKQYVGPEFLENYRPDVVIVMNSIYLNEVQGELHRRQLFPQIVGL